MKSRIALLILFIFILAACATPPPSIVPATADATSEIKDDIVTLTVLYTNDEHGWMLGEEKGRRAANMAGLWQETFGYADDGNFLVLSGDGYTLFAHYDPDAYNTGIDWRQPVIDWILDQDSDPARPLDEAIAGLAD